MATNKNDNTTYTYLVNKFIANPTVEDATFVFNAAKYPADCGMICIFCLFLFSLFVGFFIRFASLGVRLSIIHRVHYIMNCGFCLLHRFFRREYA